MALLSRILGFFGVLALSYAVAKSPTELDRAVGQTFKENRKLQKSYHERLLTQKKANKTNSKKKVLDDVPVELGSDVPDIDYQPTSTPDEGGN
jgi:hypothetical protein